MLSFDNSLPALPFRLSRFFLLVGQSGISYVSILNDPFREVVSESIGIVQIKHEG